QRADETGEAVQVEQTFRGRLEQAFLEQPDRHIGGEEQIVELEPAAERKKRDQLARIARWRQAIEPRRHRDRLSHRHNVSSPWRSCFGAFFSAADSGRCPPLYRPLGTRRRDKPMNGSI